MRVAVLVFSETEQNFFFLSSSYEFLIDSLDWVSLLATAKPAVRQVCKHLCSLFMCEMDVFGAVLILDLLHWELWVVVSSVSREEMKEEFLPSSPRQYNYVMRKLDGTLVHQHMGLLSASGQTDSKAASVCLCSIIWAALRAYVQGSAAAKT